MSVYDIGDGYYLISKNCPVCRKIQKIIVPQQGYDRWWNGELIQNALSTLSPSERECLMTGICNDCFPSE